jgi:hypothetical protein
MHGIYANQIKNSRSNALCLFVRSMCQVVDSRCVNELKALGSVVLIICRIVWLIKCAAVSVELPEALS